jgi:hypothetical protein
MVICIKADRAPTGVPPRKESGLSVMRTEVGEMVKQSEREGAELGPIGRQAVARIADPAWMYEYFWAASNPDGELAFALRPRRGRGIRSKPLR